MSITEAMQITPVDGDKENSEEEISSENLEATLGEAKESAVNLIQNEEEIDG